MQLRVEKFCDRCIKVYAGGEEVYVLYNSKNNSNPTKHFNDKQIVWQQQQQQQLAKFVDFWRAYKTKVIAQNQKPSNLVHVMVEQGWQTLFSKTRSSICINGSTSYSLLQSQQIFDYLKIYKFSQARNTIYPNFYMTEYRKNRYFTKNFKKKWKQKF